MCVCVYVLATTKLILHPLILNIPIHFTGSNVRMIPGFYMFMSTQKQYKSQFSEELVKYNKFERLIMYDEEKQNYWLSRKYQFKLIDSHK